MSSRRRPGSTHQRSSQLKSGSRPSPGRGLRLSVEADQAAGVGSGFEGAEILGAVLPRPFERVIGETGGVRPGRPGHHRTAGALAPDLQLLDRGGAERIAGREHYASAGVAVLLGELADRRRLAAAVDPDDQDYK